MVSGEGAHKIKAIENIKSKVTQKIVLFFEILMYVYCIVRRVIFFFVIVMCS